MYILIYLHQIYIYFYTQEKQTTATKTPAINYASKRLHRPYFEILLKGIEEIASWNYLSYGFQILWNHDEKHPHLSVSYIFTKDRSKPTAYNFLQKVGYGF